MTFVTLPLVPRFWLIPKWSPMVLILQRHGLVLWMLTLQLRILCQQIYLIWTDKFFESLKAEKETFEKKPKKIRRRYLRKKVAIERVKSQRMLCHRRTKTQVLMTEGGGILCSIGVIVRMVSLSQVSSWGVYLFGIWHFGQCLVLATSQLLSQNTPASIPYCFLKS